MEEFILTQSTLARIQPGAPRIPPSVVLPYAHPVVNLAQLTRFAARILINEHETVPLPESEPKLTKEAVLMKCNIADWQARLSGRKPKLNVNVNQDGAPKKDEDMGHLLPTSRSGVIYVSTVMTGLRYPGTLPNKGKVNIKPPASLTLEDEEEQGEEKIVSFLFARYKPTMPVLAPHLKTDLQNYEASKHSDHSDHLTSVPSRIQRLIQDERCGGVTQIWMCGTEPTLRRKHLMSTNLGLLEQEVRYWKEGCSPEEKNKKCNEEEQCVSGVVTANVTPLRFPGMVQFLFKNGFQGGDKITTSENKLFYWKEVK
ncbi:hypothetical protein FBU30_003727 [Linnemannia zychae]|nr:hypothetical protein FBU30_003727 [Linnemannia zychae]